MPCWVTVSYTHLDVYKRQVIYTTSRKDLGVPEIDRKELEEFIDAIPEIHVIVRDNIKEDARIKAFDPVSYTHLRLPSPYPTSISYKILVTL